MSVIVASYGGGVNSTAMLIGMAERGETPDLVLFSDTGGERPDTYAYVRHFSQWLETHGMPAIVTVKAPNDTLEGMCRRLSVLPPIAFGFKTCSLRFKTEPQQKYLRHWEAAREAWQRGEKILRLVGYDADEPHRAKVYEDERYTNRYPLIEWGWGRDECIAAIARAGLCVPDKSSCFFCPHMKPSEIVRLRRDYPELAARALEIERRALPGLTTVKGLGRGFSWQALLDADEQQIPLLVIAPNVEPCECYDGGE